MNYILLQFIRKNGTAGIKNRLNIVIHDYMLVIQMAGDSKRARASLFPIYFYHINKTKLFIILRKKHVTS